MELIPWLVKSTLALAAASLVAALLTRASAALRHQVWVCALLALLALPAVVYVAPEWRPSRGAAQQGGSVPARIVLTVVAGAPDGPAAARVPWLWWLWGAGAAALLGREAARRLRAGEMIRAARPHPDMPDVLISAKSGVPAVHGVWRPVIVLPQESVSWSAERLALVLEHERMHLRRRDPLSLFLGRCATALWWPQPLAWYALACLAREAEQAADDGVLARGARPSAYATHLVDIARSLSFQSSAIEGGLPMIRISELERRLNALLNPSIDRRPAARGSFAAFALLGAALLVPLAAVRAPAQAGAGISGVVEDASGARVPKARITVMSQSDRSREFAIAGEDGSFVLAPLPAGVYNVEAAAKGFAKLQLAGVEVKSDERTNLRLVLNLGTISERVTVTGTGAPRPSATPPPAGGAKRVTVGGNVQASRLVTRVNPVYPAGCKASGIEGTVILRALIGTDGSIVNLERVNKLVDDRLADAAIDAVKQWRWEPTLLNGAPVEVLTEVEVNFTLLK